MKSWVPVSWMIPVLAAVEFALGVDPPVWSTPKADSAPQLASDIDGYLLNLESKGLSGVVLITQDNRDLLFKAYGFSNQEDQKRMSTETGFLHRLDRETDHEGGHRPARVRWKTPAE